MTLYYNKDGITLYHGDCLEIMPILPAQSIDAVICDPPYGTTACAWDTPIPFAPMWAALKRLSKPRAAIVLFARQPFTSVLTCSNIDNYKHKWVWNKKLSGSFQNAKHQPLAIDEDILVFGFGSTVNYYPTMAKGKLRYKGGHNGSAVSNGLKPFARYLSEDYYPVNILEYGNTDRLDRLHPTQKPLALLEYLVKTYTHPGDTVLDFTAGSGTTLRACKNLDRRCIGIELLDRYCQATVARLEPRFEEALIAAPADWTGTLFEEVA